MCVSSVPKAQIFIGFIILGDENVKVTTLKIQSDYGLLNPNLSTHIIIYSAGLNRNPGKVVLARKVKKINKSTIGIFLKV